MKLAAYLDSKQSRKAADLIIRKGRTLSLVLYLSGLGWLMLLPHEQFNRGNFLDENALMAGLVNREFNDQGSISKYAGKLKDISSDEKMYMTQLEAELMALGLEVYSQNFSATKPVTTDLEDPVVKGRNVYGIMRASRAQSTEAIILSAPFLTPEKGGNVYGAAIMLSLAKYFEGKNYWAKDLIFLVTSHEEVGMQAWVDQYMGLQQATTGRGFTIRSSSLPGRSGAIQAAINLEISSPDIKYVKVIIEGMNGILPNLDLVNVVVYLCHLENMPLGFHDRWEWLQPSQFLGSNHHMALYTTLAMASFQAPGLPQGGHAHFLQHRIDSVTVRGVEDPMKTRSSKVSRNLRSVARALEGTFRSVNNLLETLHHSEFFYLTSNTWRFISIGQYMPPLAFLLAPLVLEALSQWLQARNPHFTSSNLQRPGSSPPFPFQAVMLLILSCYGSGLLLYSSSLISCHLFYPLTPHGLLYSLLVPSIATLFLPLLWRSELDSGSWRMAKFFMLIFSLLTLMALGILNFPLAISTSLMLTIPTVLAQPHLKHRSGVVHGVQMLCTLFFFPLLSLILFSASYLYFFIPSSSSFSLVEGMGFTLKGMASALNAWHFFSCWLFPACCLGVWPLWLMGWSLNCQKETAQKKHLD